MTSPSPPRQWSIRTKSVALVGGYVLALCAVYGAFAVHLVQREVSAAHERFAQTARIVAADIDAYIASGRQRLTTVTQLPGMAYGLRTIQEAKGEGYIPPWTTLHYLFFKSPVFTGGVFLLDRAGKVLWTEPPGLPWLGQNLASYAPIAELYRTKQALSSAGIAGDPVLDRPHVVVGTPIQSSTGEVDGILGGIVDLTAAEFTEILNAASTTEGRFVDVIDQGGLVVASTDPTRRFRPSRVAAARAGLMFASAPLVEARWQVLAGQPSAIGLAPVWRFERQLGGIGAGLLLLAVAVGAPLVNGFVRSIKQLTDAADIMARGDLSQPVMIGGRHDELATLAQTFEQMRVELQRSRLALEQRLEEREELIRLKEEFLANISHELRTPLHVIIGYTEMLLEQPLSDDIRDAPLRIQSQSQRLFDLLTDLMNLSSLNSGKIALQVSPVPVSSLLGRLTPLVEQFRRGTDIEVVWDCAPSLPVIDTDALRLEQVLTNLIANAFKFTERGRITIRAQPAAAPAGVLFAVADTGIGIPPDELPYIFDEFRQVDGSLRRPYGGVGLGLALVKKLTALLQGEVTVESHLGEGSTFTVTIPVQPSTDSTQRESHRNDRRGG